MNEEPKKYSEWEMKMLLGKRDKAIRSETHTTTRTKERYRIKGLPWWRRLTNNF